MIISVGVFITLIDLEKADLNSCLMGERSTKGGQKQQVLFIGACFEIDK